MNFIKSTFFNFSYLDHLSKLNDRNIYNDLCRKLNGLVN